MITGVPGIERVSRCWELTQEMGMGWVGVVELRECIGGRNAGSTGRRKVVPWE